MKNFALIGAAGYIAPRHMQAIKETRNRLVAALDPHDSVGVLDHYFPECDFFTEFERFDRHCEKLKRNGIPIDYVVVCSPNYLHDAHCRFGLRIGANVICEKPVVLNPWNMDGLLKMEEETGKHIYTILQLRLHPAVQQLRAYIKNAGESKRHDVILKYITPRGNWYNHSWKGDLEKSGGIISNIGLHFFDVLLWIFGEVKESIVNKTSAGSASGTLKLAGADVNWFLSINKTDLPSQLEGIAPEKSRLLQVDEEVFDFSTGFEELHTKAYEGILAGSGTPLAESYPLIQLLHDVRKQVTA